MTLIPVHKKHKRQTLNTEPTPQKLFCKQLLTKKRFTLFAGINTKHKLKIRLCNVFEQTVELKL